VLGDRVDLGGGAGFGFQGFVPPSVDDVGRMAEGGVSARRQNNGAIYLHRGGSRSHFGTKVHCAKCSTYRVASVARREAMAEIGIKVVAVVRVRTDQENIIWDGSRSRMALFQKPGGVQC
jgi:hypothetical protein